MSCSNGDVEATESNGLSKITRFGILDLTVYPSPIPATYNISEALLPPTHFNNLQHCFLTRPVMPENLRDAFYTAKLFAVSSWVVSRVF